MPIETPYSDRLAALKQKLQKHPGRDKLRDQLQTVKAKNQGYKAGIPNNQNPALGGQSPVPYSGAFDSTMASLNQNLGNTQLDLAGQGLALEQQYGFGGDTSNPFSVARQLERQYAQQRNQTTNSYAAAGQLYAGSTSNAMASDRYNFEQSSDSAYRDFLSKKAELASRGVESTNQYNTSAAEAYAAKLEEALNQPVDPTEAGGGQGGGGNQGGKGQGGGKGGGNQGGGNQDRDRQERERRQREEEERRRGQFNRTHEHGKPIKKGKK